MTDALERLADLCGILPEYTDANGRRQSTSPDTRRALLAAMGIDVDSDEQIAAAIVQREERDWQRPLPPAVVTMESDGPTPLSITLPATSAATPLRYVLRAEDGSEDSGLLTPSELPLLESRDAGGVARERRAWDLPALPCGYHALELESDDVRTSTTVIVTPARCYQPDVLHHDGRVWGPALQLYALRSHRNWGIGDYGDLSDAVGFFGRAGAGLVGLGPLHSLYPHEPRHASPYSPSTRLYWNVLYIDVEAVPGFDDCEAARDRLADPAFRARIVAARESEQVDYPAVAAAKREVLEILYDAFRTRHQSGDTAAGEEYRRFREAADPSLERHALYEALAAAFHRRNPGAWGWPAWPDGHEHPGTDAVGAFAAGHPEEVGFFVWLQWLAERQIAAAAERSAQLGLGIGLYLDLPLGADRGGSEVWSRRALYADAVSIGAPPDDFNLRGQDWGLPPWIPERLTEAGYRPFIELLRHNMRHAGAVRMDHVMALMRLFWIPHGWEPVEGAYVRYPLEALLGILRLESQRNRCLVIGEDLGTVPESLRETLATSGVLSTRLFYFEKRQDGTFRPPGEWPRQALVAASTHDLPTLRGYWLGEDLTLRQRLGLFPSERQREEQIVERAQDRARILAALSQDGLLPANVDADPAHVPDLEADLMIAVHRYLARSPAMAAAFQMEDALLLPDQANLPGTTDEHPNWRRKLTVELEQWDTQRALHGLLGALRAERGSGSRVAHGPGRRAPVIPAATYRLQLSGAFRFTDVAEIAPYLARLGVSHCYLSPYLKARPGSTHGYDVIDHDELNSEIGSRADFDAMVETLRRDGLGQIADIVPNHMAVMGSDNAWWLDVLENGRASPYAGYFDIDWRPVQAELQGKVLIPILGNPYGVVLERGELQPAFDSERGALFIRYFEHTLPLDPVTYPDVLDTETAQLADRLGEDSADFAEFLSILRGFGQLPSRDTGDPARIAERLREKEVGKRRLAELCRRSVPVREHVETRLAVLAGTPGDPETFDGLHRLFERQAWRVAYWKVAADEINYRRFFDINELAGLCTEKPPVLAATHGLMAELYRTGKVDGLRIDHPDGLYDPADYFARLQQLLSGEDGGGDPSTRAYVVVEKILAAHEHLREDWPVHGTTGYDFAFLVNGLFVRPDAVKSMTRCYRAFTGEHEDFDELLYRCKRLIIHVHLSSELTTLANLLNQIARGDRYARDFTLNSMRDALTEIVASFPVYRTYVSSRTVSATDRDFIDWAVAWARRRDSGTSRGLYTYVRRLLLLDLPATLPEAQHERCERFAMKFQQYTAPITAKALEDTAFYRYNRLVSLNEVGGNPQQFGLSVAAFHRQNGERRQRWPHGMLAGSTHDNKRSEDVRARLNVLTEFPQEWSGRVRRWRRLNRRWRTPLASGQAPARRDEYLYYQTAFGIWPLRMPDAQELEDLTDRLVGFMRKAVREAKEYSSWMRPDEDYEDAIESFVRRSLDPADGNPFLDDLNEFAQRLAPYGLLNSLGQTALRLTAPGMPDIYQGNELWDFSLVDPDNRRPVDFRSRERVLCELEQRAAERPADLLTLAGELLQHLYDGRAKLYLLWRLLGLRTAYRAVFDRGDYLPLRVDGQCAEHVCAFARRQAGVTVVVVAGRWFAGLQPDEATGEPVRAARWGDTRIAMPEHDDPLEDRITGLVHAAGDGTVAAADLLQHWPVAILVAAGRTAAE